MAVGAVLTLPPIPQDPHYHNFADQREFLAIPNFFDVVSNLPFVVVGLLGLVHLRKGASGGLTALLWHYRIFFFGVLLTGFGSAYYHWEPSNATLFWDRLPMTIGFMAFFCLLVGERISVRAGVLLLPPLLLVGMFAVIYWHFTELRGQGDLRLYLLVQFLPMLLTPYVLIFYPSVFTQSFWYWALAALYLLAKVLELTDHFWLDLTGLISGHSLKHLAAAAATYCMLRSLQKRCRL